VLLRQDRDHSRGTQDEADPPRAATPPQPPVGARVCRTPACVLLVLLALPASPVVATLHVPPWSPVFDRAVYGSEPELRQQARRGWVVLTDMLYVVRGPDGERQVCRPCVERCGFRRHDDDEDWESLTNAGEF
jgi:hypothetical protein